MVDVVGGMAVGVVDMSVEERNVGVKAREHI